MSSREIRLYVDVSSHNLTYFPFRETQLTAAASIMEATKELSQRDMELWHETATSLRSIGVYIL